MEIISGGTRVAIIGRKYVLKTPLLGGSDLRESIQGIVSDAAAAVKSILKDKKPLAKLGSEVRKVARGFRRLKQPWNIYIAGIKGNYREWKYYPALKGLVVPTRFSLFGLVNVMCTAKRQKHAFMQWDPYSNVKSLFLYELGWYKGELMILDYHTQEQVERLLAGKDMLRGKLDMFAQRYCQPN